MYIYTDQPTDHHKWGSAQPPTRAPRKGGGLITIQVMQVTAGSTIFTIWSSKFCDLRMSELIILHVTDWYVALGKSRNTFLLKSKTLWGAACPQRICNFCRCFLLNPKSAGCSLPTGGIKPKHARLPPPIGWNQLVQLAGTTFVCRKRNACGRTARHDKLTTCLTRPGVCWL